jgi:CRP-like cAMP-binding protein
MTGQPQRLATVSAMTECVIVRIAKADITRVIHEEPAFAELFIARLLARNSRVEEDLVINRLIRARNAWHGPFCFWPILAR